MPQVYEVTRGSSRDLPLKARVKLNAQPFEILVTDVLTAKVWTGDDQAPLASPGVVVNGTAPTDNYLIRFLDTDTATLEAGDYQLGAFLTRGGRTVPLTSGAILRVLPAPGVGTPRMVLVTHDQVLSFATSLDAVLRVGQDQTGYREQRADASAEFLKWIVDRYIARPGFARIRQSVPHEHQGYDVQFFGAPPPTKGQVQAWINTPARLVMNEVDVEIVSRIAIAIILGDEMLVEGRGSAYAVTAAANRDRVRMLQKMHQAYIDTNGDGAPDILVDHDVTFLDLTTAKLQGVASATGGLIA